MIKYNKACCPIPGPIQESAKTCGVELASVSYYRRNNICKEQGITCKSIFQIQTYRSGGELDDFISYMTDCGYVVLYKDRIPRFCYTDVNCRGRGYKGPGALKGPSYPPEGEAPGRINDVVERQKRTSLEVPPAPGESEDVEIGRIRIDLIITANIKNGNINIKGAQNNDG